jgi:hypothetical protein
VQNSIQSKKEGIRDSNPFELDEEEEGGGGGGFG